MKKRVTIYVDTREQKPYEFDGVHTEKRALKTGDYSVKGGLGVNGIVVERKSIDDLFSTLAKTSNQKRFEKELMRMSKYGFKVLVLECNAADIIRGHHRTSANGRLVLKYLLELCLKYQVVPIFCGDRSTAITITKDLLTQYVVLDVARRWWCK